LSKVTLGSSYMPAFKGACEAAVEVMEKSGKLDLTELTSLIRCYNLSVETVRKFFPGATNSKDILTQLDATLKRLDVTGENTLYAQSVCPDEINHEEGDITDILASYMGEVFHLGGLAGLPFTGRTGFAAFSHHVPDGGNLFILMAPHIGISDSHQLGMYSRVGQERDGTACGAAVGALKAACSLDSPLTLESLGGCFEDYQMNFIISEVQKRKDEICKEPEGNPRQAALIHAVYDVSKKFLDNIVSTEFGDRQGKLFLLCGVQINMPKPMEDFFQPLAFEMLQHGKERVDLFEETFGPRSMEHTGEDEETIAPPASEGTGCDHSHLILGDSQRSTNWRERNTERESRGMES